VYQFQSSGFMFHLHLPGLCAILRQCLAFPRMFHFQFEQLQILQLPAEIVNQLQKEKKIRHLEQNDILTVTFQVSCQGERVPHLLHGFFFLLKLMPVIPELVHYLSVQVHLIFQPQTRVLQLVRHSLLLLQRDRER